MMFAGDGGTVLLPVLPPQLPVPVGVVCGLTQTGNGMVLNYHHAMNRRVHMQPPPQGHFVCAVQQQLLQPRMMAAHSEECRVEVRDVWAVNLHQELSRISNLLHRYPVVCIDTEFPGTVHDSGTLRHLRTPRESYALVKRNVDELRLLQLGLALCGRAGQCRAVWQFNFRGFDEARHPHAPSSIAMLKAQGMDFTALRRFGIDPDVFASKLRFVLGRKYLTWVAFSGSYDFAYLAKVLGGGHPLPEKLEEFRDLVGRLFGPRVLDVKYIARFCGEGGGIRGGLEQVAAALGVERAAGCAHNAGSDSLLTADVLRAMAGRFFMYRDMYVHAGKIEGIAVL